MRYEHEVRQLVCGDETTAIAATGVVHASHMPYPMTVYGVRASLTTGPTTGVMLVDVLEEGTSILAAPIRLIAGATTSTVSSSLPFVVDDVLGDAARITVEVIDEASGDAAGLKVDIIGARWIIPFGAPYGLSGPSGAGVGLPVVPIPTPRPHVTINQATGQDDPAEDEPILFDVVFSEPVDDFDTGDVTLSGTAGATTDTVIDSGDHIHYTVEVTGMTGNGTVIATIAAGVCTSTASGIANAASTSTDNTVTYAAPLTVTINQGSGQADPAFGSSIVFDVVFSEAVTGFATGEVTLTGTATGTLVGTVADSGDHIHYTVTVTGMTGSGTVIADIDAGVCTSVATAAANEASTSTDNTVTWSSGVFDSFNRANNSSSLGNADSGQTWVPGPGVSTPVWGITSNTAYQSTNYTVTNAEPVALIDSSLVACTIQVDVTTAQAGNSIGAGLTFRYDDNNNHFLFMFYRSGGGSLFWFLQKVVAGSNTTIANGGASAITGTLKVVDTGSNIKVYIDGVQVGAGGGYSETALNTKTKQGLYITYTTLGGANDGTGWRFDNYSCV